MADVDQVKKDSANIAIPTVTIIIILIIVAIFVYKYYTSQAPPPAFVCPIGYCATNIYNGEKRCPQTTTDSIAYQVTYETCNPSQGCNSSNTPFVYYDVNLGTDASSQLCPTDTSSEDCKCINGFMCSNDVGTYWILRTTNSQGYTLNRLMQATAWTNQFGTTYGRPFNIGNPALNGTSCGAPRDYVLSGLISPGCGTTATLYTNNCVSGKLVFIGDCDTNVTECSQFDIQNKGNFVCLLNDEVNQMGDIQGYDNWLMKSNGKYSWVNTSQLVYDNNLPSSTSPCT